VSTCCGFERSSDRGTEAPRRLGSFPRSGKAGAPGGFLGRLSSATCLGLGKAREALRFLELQVLVKRDRDRFLLRDNLRELLREQNGGDAPGS
jgi:hypothetical protein